MCNQSLLSLELLSYIVAPIRDTRNITSFTLAITFKPMNITSLLAPVAMDINNFNANNYDNIRGQTLSHSKTNLRTVSMYSSKASEVYHAKME